MSKRALELLEIFKDNEVTTSGCITRVDEQDLVYRLRKRAEIRRQIKDRKSVQEGRADRIADLLEEAAQELEKERALLAESAKTIASQQNQIADWQRSYRSLEQMLNDYGGGLKMFKD
jgi:3-methyladenine DNA glycosylase/8-oxoguanine DNA glycosylase